MMHHRLWSGKGDGSTHVQLGRGHSAPQGAPKGASPISYTAHSSPSQPKDSTFGTDNSKIYLKDERTQEFLTPWTGDGETESEALSDGGGEASAVLYGMLYPQQFSEEAVKNMLRQTMEVSKVSRLCWTPGDASMAVWRSGGKGKG